MLELQGEARGAMVRIGLGENMQSLRDSEVILVNLQSAVRGGGARQIFGYRLSMKLLLLVFRAPHEAFE